MLTQVHYVATNCGSCVTFDTVCVCVCVCVCPYKWVHLSDSRCPLPSRAGHVVVPCVCLLVQTLEVHSEKAESPAVCL